mmetsp:Transcript_22734/g.33574  ORF Transcript_22734/g.33574 Transcript_22734/m.33574 type:complete len:224 (+) Transcript_22734:94-765(+)|eukprot:CAMPEP_0194224194 /NCGR_PEP_ID=MMETSP0156-20130528/36886_1 /TAXON_ID=33649 /ORGANISM="Thalassionema nitzschioides, Strain L26-B" /LENGTH=223 /DNA_ID=CAMNT_0038955639 /DNA_START=51 /DNA_END=722 /DNA_ORIENTATION=+
MERLGMYDVICNSRSKRSFDHVGNRRFRVMIENHVVNYDKAYSKTDKGIIVTSILRTIQDAGGNFIRKSQRNSDNKQYFWEILPKAQSKEKIGHTLRDAAIALGQGDGKRDIYQIIGGCRNSNNLKFKVKGRLSMKAIMGKKCHSIIEDMAQSTRPRARIPLHNNARYSGPDKLYSSQLINDVEPLAVISNFDHINKEHHSTCSSDGTSTPSIQEEAGDDGID